MTGKAKTDKERNEERNRRFEESKEKYGKKEKGKVTSKEDEIEIVTEVPADAVSVPPADRKLAERRRQSQVDRLLAKSAKIAAPILAKRAAIPTASNPSQAAENNKQNHIYVFSQTLLNHFFIWLYNYKTLSICGKLPIEDGCTQCSIM